jgi:hypothetical protein
MLSAKNAVSFLAEGDYNTSHTDELIFKFNTFGWKFFNVQPVVRDWVAPVRLRRTNLQQLWFTVKGDQRRYLRL